MVAGVVAMVPIRQTDLLLLSLAGEEEVPVNQQIHIVSPLNRD